MAVTKKEEEQNQFKKQRKHGKHENAKSSKYPHCFWIYTQKIIEYFQGSSLLL